MKRIAQTSLSFERTVHDTPTNITPQGLRRTGQESPFPMQRRGNQRFVRHRLVSNTPMQTHLLLVVRTCDEPSLISRLAPRTST